jgi:hypothetical protein
MRGVSIEPQTTLGRFFFGGSTMKVFAVIMWLIALGAVILVDYYLHGEITNLGRGGIIVLIVLAFFGRALQKFVKKWRESNYMYIRLGNKTFKIFDKRRPQGD